MPGAWAVGRRELIVSAVGEACTPADSVASMVVSMVSADSTAAGADFSEAGTRTIRTLEEYMSRELSNVAIAMWAGLLLTLLVLTIVPVSHTIAAAGRNSPRT